MTSEMLLTGFVVLSLYLSWSMRNWRMTGGVLPFSNRTREIARRMLWTSREGMFV